MFCGDYKRQLPEQLSALISAPYESVSGEKSPEQIAFLYECVFLPGLRYFYECSVAPNARYLNGSQMVLSDSPPPRRKARADGRIAAKWPSISERPLAIESRF
jgi:hypothetical protein